MAVNLPFDTIYCIVWTLWAPTHFSYFTPKPNEQNLKKLTTKKEREKKVSKYILWTLPCICQALRLPTHSRVGFSKDHLVYTIMAL